MAMLLTKSSRLCLFAGSEAVCTKALCAELGALSSSAASSLSMSSPTNPKENAADMSARFSLYIGEPREPHKRRWFCRKNEWPAKTCQEVTCFGSSPVHWGLRLEALHKN